MKFDRNQLTVPDAGVVHCPVSACGIVRATPEELKALRQSPGPKPGEPLPSAFLKHADDQTVAGLAAVLRAIAGHGLSETSFTRWGVIAAPRFLARALLAQALQRFMAEGAWGVSPHLIPHRSLHAISGTISQALAIHGPNFGVGGGPCSESKALLVGASLLQGDRLPGVWVVLTAWNQEPWLDATHRAEAAARSAITPVCSAVALALTHETAADWRLSVQAGNGDEPRDLATFRVESLIDVLTGTSPGPNAAWRLASGGWAELERTKDWTEART